MRNSKLLLLNFLLAAFVGLVSFNTATAQGQKKNRDEVREKLQTHKIAYITESLALTESEAEKFWPVYRAYEKEKKALRADRHKEVNYESLTEKESDALLTQIMDYKAKDLELHKIYITKMKTAIPAWKVAKLFNAEHEFKNKMVGKIKERREKKEWKSN